MRSALLALTFIIGMAVSAMAADKAIAVVSTVAGVPGLAGFDDGPAASATFNRPTWIDIARNGQYSRFGWAAAGDIFVVDRLNESIRLISVNGVSTYKVFSRLVNFLPVGPVNWDFGGPLGGGIVMEPLKSGCGGSEYDSGMFVASSGTHQIALVSMVGLLGARDDVSPLIGLGDAPGSRDGFAGPINHSEDVVAEFRTPGGLALSWDYADDSPSLYNKRRLYIADTGNHTIRQVRFMSSFENCPQPRNVETIAGLAGQAGGVDGVGSAARFNSPRGLVAGPDGSLYVADTGNHAIRKIAPDGKVTTIAGELGVAGSNDGPARSAHLNSPSGIDINTKGEIFIADTSNHVIRMITADGMLVTIAGTPGVQGFADGIASSAKFAGPVGLRIAPDGSILIADTSNNAIRRLAMIPATARRRPVGH